MALAHPVGNEVEADYRRGDRFDKHGHLCIDGLPFCSRPIALPSV